MKTFTQTFLAVVLTCYAGLAISQDTLFYYDFNGDLDGFEVEDLSGAMSGDAWTFSTTGPSGDFSIAAILSTTAANGYALFDSDLQCSGSQNSRLQSPMLDLTGEAEVEIRYQERYRKFQDNIFLEVSTDGGATFAAQALYPDLAANAFSGDNPEIVRVDISGLAAGQDSVVFAFRFEGACDYAWMIDDIAVVDMVTPRPNTDLVISEEFFANAPSFATPASQTAGQNLYFLADVLNDGGLTQTNVRLTIDILNEDDGLIFTDTLDYGSIESDVLEENKAFMNSFPLPTEVGSYRGVYTLTSDSTATDANPDDNTIEFDFEITENLYAKAPTLQGGISPAQSAEDFEAGNIYYTPNLDGFAKVTIDSIAYGFSLDGLTDNVDATLIVINTYGYRGDLNDDGAPNIGDDDEDDAEFVLLATNEVEFDAITSPEGFFSDVITPDFDGEEVVIPTDQGYIGYAVGVSYVESANPGGTEDRFFIGTNNDVNYSAYDLATDTLNIDEAFTTYALQPNAAVTASFNAFNRSLFVNTVLGFEIDSKTTELPSGSLAVRPNPANTELYVDIALETASEVTLVVTNAVGQEVMRQQESNAGNNTVQLNTTQLRQGLYFLELISADNRRAVQRFMIKR